MAKLSRIWPPSLLRIIPDLEALSFLLYSCVNEGCFNDTCFLSRKRSCVCIFQHFQSMNFYNILNSIFHCVLCFRLNKAHNTS